MYCRNCGSILPDEAKFCSQCGTTIKKRRSWLPITLISIIIVIGVGGVVGAHFLIGSKTKFDENNIGEVYYAQIDPDHVSETDIGTLYADNELLIVASENAEYDDIEKIVTEYNGEIVGWIEQTGDFQIKFPNTYTISELNQISEKISKNKLIISSNPNYIVEYVNDDFYGFEFGKEWESDIQVFDYLGKSWGWEVIRTFDAWWYMDKIKANGASINPIRVGLIDDGFDMNHEDLDFALKNIGVYTKSTESHGTHVAGTMAANSNNKEGICGVYPYGDGRLYGVSWEKAYGIQENNVSCIAEKCLLAELILRNVKVINCSYGIEQENLIINYWNGKKYPQLANETKEDFNHRAEDMGNFLNKFLDKGYDFIIVSSAGNDSNKTHRLEHDENGITESLSINVKRVDSFYNNYFSAIPNNDKYKEIYNRIIIVGAVDSLYDIAYYSNVSSRNDIYAPGGDGKDKKYKNQIFSTDVNGSYGLKVGTSMAAPHVSGVAALVWTVNNDLTGAEVKNIICDDSNRSKVVTSCKMVDAYNCVVAASNTKKNTKLYDKKNGGVLNFVVDKDNESIRIEGAKVTAMKGSEIVSTTQTDQYGHFELILPAGIYDIIVEKESYDAYTWSNITVKSGEVNYLSDWTKLELEKIVVELPDTKDIFYRYIKSDLVPVYGLSELRVNQINYAEKPNYDGVNGIISAYINEVDSQAYLITIRFSNQAEKPHLIFEMYQYINNEVVKIDTFDNELDEYTLGFNAGLSDNYLCFYDYRHFNYASSSYGLHYYILKITKSGFEKTFNLCYSHAAGGVNWIHNLFMDDKSYFETSDGSGDGLLEAVETIKDDLKSIGFNNYEIKCDIDPESFVFNTKYDEDIMSCSLYEQNITDFTDLRSHLNFNDETDFDIIKAGRYENDSIKVDVVGSLNEEGKIRIEYNLDDSHVSVANYQGVLKPKLDFKASDWFAENSYSIEFNTDSIDISIQENNYWNQAAGISLPKAEATLNFKSLDTPNYDISSWTEEMIIQAINCYLKGSEKWNKYAAFTVDVSNNEVFLRYQGGSEANTLTNLVVFWGLHEDYAQFAQSQSDAFGELFHLTEYIDNSSSKSEFDSQTGIVITEKDDLNVRASSSTRSEIIGTVPKGGIVYIVSKENGWYKIRFNSGYGYVSEEFIKLSDSSSSNKSYTEPVIEVYTASPWANGLTYILHMEGDFSSYSYVLYTNESSNELVYTSSGTSDQATIELCSSSTISKVKVLITPYNKDNKPGQTIQIEADDSNPISISPINSVDKKGAINVHGGVVAGYNKTYVVYNGKPNEKIRESLGNGWHITAIAEYEKDGITWYDLYDADDHDYYGWVDSKYIDFN